MQDAPIYTPPQVFDLGTVTEVTLGNKRDDRPDSSQYFDNNL